MAKGLLIIKTLTPTHPGAGTSLGAIDLMLQREVTTDFPFIQGSSLKGAIRNYLENQPVRAEESLVRELLEEVKIRLKKERSENEPDKLLSEIQYYQENSSIFPTFKAREYIQMLINTARDEREQSEIKSKFSPLYKALDQVFGPYTPKGEIEKGSLIISDASLLFYPVRSLKGLYALVTCPEILRRLTMPHIGLEISDSILNIEDKGNVMALETTKSKYAINGRVYFEDLNFSVKTINSNELSWIGQELGLNDDIKSRLFIVHNDVFQYFVVFATQVISRNRISYKTGIVETGALWSEEHLPPETYLFSYLEDDGEPVDGSQPAFKWLESKFASSNVIHLGGDETVGKGFVELGFKELQEG
ncbi:MAG: type III-B CRISPR module RAMP protein Cmr4 [Candidatus Hydrothermae bacterium]|nr:type III-B CRISPR module RAMP protein Cmr4 [Candidatus Hydrothermae bacterium]